MHWLLDEDEEASEQGSSVVQLIISLDRPSQRWQHWRSLCVHEFRYLGNRMCMHLKCISFMRPLQGSNGIGPDVPGASTSVANRIGWLGRQWMGHACWLQAADSRNEPTILGTVPGLQGILRGIGVVMVSSLHFTGASKCVWSMVYCTSYIAHQLTERMPFSLGGMRMAGMCIILLRGILG